MIWSAIPLSESRCLGQRNEEICERRESCLRYLQRNKPIEIRLIRHEMLCGWESIAFGWQSTKVYQDYFIEASI